ncbi:RDD family protein, partial [Saccharomonospora saliphila]|uniref:RDD family protein n=1 Tax=Saccharomonospora saliphila TaxID=369829 RepID=UPI0003772F11
MRGESDLVTGDAVVLDLRLARSASRALGYALDLLVQVASLLLVLLVFALTPVTGDTALLLAVITTVQLAVLIGYPTLLETLTRGRTLGKMALGLRVVRADGGPIRFRHALIRALAGAFVDFGPFGAWSVVGFLTSLSSEQGKRVGDYLAGTVVVRERAPRSAATMELAMPPALAAWASGLDLTGLPDDLALAARQYLGRYHELDEGSRERVGARLAAEVAHRIGAPVPAGVPPWAYL